MNITTVIHPGMFYLLRLQSHLSLADIINYDWSKACNRRAAVNASVLQSNR